MYNILSSGSKTLLSDFQNLHQISTYTHFNDEPEDFQLFPGSTIYSSLNKSYGFELRQIIRENEEDIIQVMKKRRLNNINAIASSTIDMGEIALGFTDGSIQFFNFKMAEYTPVEFRSGKWTFEDH